MAFKKPWVIFLSFCLAGYCLSAGAEIYKYKDKNGRWQFTDKPVNADGTPITSNQSFSKKTNSSTKSKKNNSKGDLKETLFERFNPQTKIDEATLSVVTVQTKVGSGSGFFITDNGYLITNRHVVRPSSTSGWKEAEVELKHHKERLDDYEDRLREDEESLKNMEQTIDENKAYINSGRASTSEKNSYDRYVKKYERYKDRYDENDKKHRTMKREYNRAKSEYGFATNVSSFSKKFTIILKNGKKYNSRLVKVSKKYDLALLKLDNYTTPFLSLAKQNYPRQGTEVFAIGSPLGISDNLTTGIVTKAAKDQIFTDAQILPGNSGGPLVNKDGTVLGVNTAILTQSRNSNGLGLALYAKFIKQEFGNNLPGDM